MSIKVLLAVADKLTGNALQSRLVSDGFQVIGEMHFMSDLDKVIDNKKPDILILDQCFFDNIEPIENIVKFVNTICLMNSINISLIFNGLHNDLCKGFVHKMDGYSALRESIVEVHKNKLYLSSHFSGSIVKEELSTTTKREKPLLTQKEREVARLLKENLKGKEIGLTLNISYKTVQVHITNMKRKLGLTGRDSLLHYVLSNDDI